MLRNPTATHPLTFFTPCFQLPLLLPTSPVSILYFSSQARHFHPPYRVTPWALSRGPFAPKVVVSFETSPWPTTFAPPDFELHLLLLSTSTALSPSLLCPMDHFCPQVQHFRLLYRGAPWALSRDPFAPKVVVSFETSPWPTTCAPPRF